MVLAMDVDRESAPERALAYLRSRPPGEIVAEQSAKLWNMVVHSAAFLERVERREAWGPQSQAWIHAANVIARGMWYALLVLGLAGVVLTIRRSAGWGLLGLLVLYFAGALFVASVKLRFAMPVVPVLALFSGSVIERVLLWARARAAPQR